jgi:hypothetical protein
MMISRVNHGESINWATIMYSQLVKELIKWEKVKKYMIEGTTKSEPKNGYVPFYHIPRSFVLEVVSIRTSKTTREKETCRAVIGG